MYSFLIRNAIILEVYSYMTDLFHYLSSLFSDKWMKTFQTSPWREYFIEQDNFCTDESKRLSPTKTDEVFGVAGSFRKLVID